MLDECLPMDLSCRPSHSFHQIQLIFVGLGRAVSFQGLTAFAFRSTVRLGRTSGHVKRVF